MQLAHLGLAVVAAREARGWNRAELARRALVPYTTLRHIETAERALDAPAVRPMTSEDTVRALAAALDADVDAWRLLAGYQLTTSGSKEASDARIHALLDANPSLERAIRALLKRGSQPVIDHAASYLEYLAKRRDP